MSPARPRGLEYRRGLHEVRTRARVEEEIGHLRTSSSASSQTPMAPSTPKRSTAYERQRPAKSSVAANPSASSIEAASVPGSALARDESRVGAVVRSSGRSRRPPSRRRGVPEGERLDRRHAEALVGGRRQHEEVGGRYQSARREAVGDRADEEHRARRLRARRRAVAASPDERARAGHDERASSRREEGARAAADRYPCAARDGAR
jgi:hypothetical protein